MHPFFRVTTEDIGQLTDVQARELVARLCQAEVSRRGGSTAAVTWGGDQRASDGGVDVRVEVVPPRGIATFLPNDKSCFQVKAENFNVAKIQKEMAPKGVLRPIFQALADDGAAYVIVTTRTNTSDTGLDQRTKAMGECLASHGMTTPLAVHFYDARRLADWVEQYPAIVTAVKHQVGRAMTGWHPYEAWAYRETDVTADYVFDDQTRVVAGVTGETITTLECIARIRGELTQGQAVRIVGLSGVGKTRLAQALFDPRVVTSAAALPADQALYIDIGGDQSSQPTPTAMLDALAVANEPSIMVVDNCSAETHRALMQQLPRAKGRVGLVTIEYDVRDDASEGTAFYSLEGSSETVIGALLQRRFPVLSSRDADTIIRFSEGNARVAFALAATANQAGDLAQLRDAALFARLFQQRHDVNNELLRAAEALSLLYSFNGEEDDAGSDLARLSRFAGGDVRALLRNVGELQRRGLIQRRGPWRAVLPHAIANRLAAEALGGSVTGTLIRELIDEAPERVAKSFARRLSYLHVSEQAQTIATRLLAADGRYGRLEALNEAGTEIFYSLAPASPAAALAAVTRLATSEAYLQDERRHRPQLARIARAVAYDADCFDNAARALVQLTLTDKNERGRESSSSNLKGLFQCILLGTQASPEQRQTFVRIMLASTEPERQELGAQLLGSALKTTHFSTNGQSEFGAHRRTHGWFPSTSEDRLRWYLPFLQLAVATAQVRSPPGDRCKSALGIRLRELWRLRELREELARATHVLASGADGWSLGWFAVRMILEYDLGEVDDGAEELRALETVLAPKNLWQTIEARILAAEPAVRSRRARGDAGRVGVAIAEEPLHGMPPLRLGELAAKDDAQVLERLSRWLEPSPNPAVFEFAQGLGQHTTQTSAVVERMRQAFAANPHRDLSIGFLRGFVSGWSERAPHEVAAFLDGALTDEVWIPLFVDLELSVPVDDAAFERLVRSLAEAKTPAIQYGQLCLGQATSTLSVDQVTTLLRGIEALPQRGAAIALDILHMVVHNASEHDTLYRRQLALACIERLKAPDWDGAIREDVNGTYRVSSVLEFVLGYADLRQDAMPIFSGLLSFVNSSTHSYRFEETLKSVAELFLHHMPKEALDAIYAVASQTGDEVDTDWLVLRRMGDGEETPARVVPADVLTAWCEAAPLERYPFAARVCRLFDDSNGAESRADGSWSETAELEVAPAAIEVIAHAPDKEAVIRPLVERFVPGGWSGSLAEKLRSRAPLLAQFNRDGDAATAAAVDSARTWLNNRIATEAAREQLNHQGRAERFE